MGALTWKQHSGPCIWRISDYRYAVHEVAGAGFRAFRKFSAMAVDWTGALRQTEGEAKRDAETHAMGAAA